MSDELVEKVATAIANVGLHGMPFEDCEATAKAAIAAYEEARGMAIIGTLVEVDFGKSDKTVLTFEVLPDTRVTAGDYTIAPQKAGTDE